MFKIDSNFVPYFALRFVAKRNIFHPLLSLMILFGICDTYLVYDDDIHHPPAFYISKNVYVSNAFTIFCCLFRCQFSINHLCFQNLSKSIKHKLFTFEYRNQFMNKAPALFNSKMQYNFSAIQPQKSWWISCTSPKLLSLTDSNSAALQSSFFSKKGNFM